MSLSSQKKKGDSTDIKANQHSKNMTAQTQIEMVSAVFMINIKLITLFMIKIIIITFIMNIMTNDLYMYVMATYTNYISQYVQYYRLYLWFLSICPISIYIYSKFAVIDNHSNPTRTFYHCYYYFTCNIPTFSIL